MSEKRPDSPDSDLDEAALDDLSITPVRQGQYDEPTRKSGDLGRSSGDADDAEASLLSNGEAGRPRRPRATSLGRFSFDFGNVTGLLSIPLSVDVEQREHAERNLGLVSGVALVIGGMIGSGIFSTPGIILSDVGSVGCALLVWIIGGALAWTGAATFAELGSAIPLNGGMQAYLNYSYGPLVAYLFSWTSIIGGIPGTTAAIALATSEYMCRILYHTAFTADSEESARNIPTIVIKLVTLIFVGLGGFLVAISTRVSLRVQTVLTTIKLASLLTVTILGIVQAARGRASTSLRQDVFADSSRSPGAYAIAIYSASFSYSGWDFVCYVAGEMSNAPRDLPRVTHISMATTMTLYVAANLSYFVVLEKQFVAHSNTVGLDFGKAIIGPLGGSVCYVAGEMSNAPRDLPRVTHISMATTMTLYVAANLSYFVVLEKQFVAHSNTVGLDFGKAIIGPLGGSLLALAIALSSFGAMHSSMAALSRLYAVAGQEGYMPARVGEIHPRWKTPVNATIVYTLATAVYVLVGSYKTLITTFGICSTLFFFLAATSLLVLRVREPHLDRPYRTFIGWPLIYCGTSIFLLLMPIVAAPVQFFAAAAIILSGFPGYLLIRKRGKLSFEKLYSSLPTFGSRPPRRREASNGSLHISKPPSLPRVSEAEEEDDDVVELESIRR